MPVSDHIIKMRQFLIQSTIFLMAAVLIPGCGGEEEGQNHGSRGGPGGFQSGSGRPPAAAIPVKVAEVSRGDISLFSCRPLLSNR